MAVNSGGTSGSGASTKAKKPPKTYYKITFTTENEIYQICAREVSPSDFYGLIEIKDFIFPTSKLVYNPGEERLRREFEGIRRTWVPFHSVKRIDEIADARESEIKIVPMDRGAEDLSALVPAPMPLKPK